MQDHPDWKEKVLEKPAFDIFELYAQEGKEAFATAATDRIIEDWIDANYVIVDGSSKQPYHNDPGVIYVHNPVEYKVKFYKFGNESERWRYDPERRTRSKH